jgi:GT2 family glycosyltransferase
MHDLYDYSIFPFQELSNSCNFTEKKWNTFAFNKFIYTTKDDSSGLNIKSKENLFRFNLQINKFRKNIDSVIIICSKNNKNVLKYTLSKLKKYDILKHHDVLLVDDRSDTNDILSLGEQFKVSYLRIENELDIFNYSLINNIAALYAKKLDKQLVIFYNNDMWPENENTFNNIIEKHKNYKSNITGCRLVYPSKKEYEALGKPKHLLKKFIEDAYGTIQHGGIHFIRKHSDIFKLDNNQKAIVMCPMHLYRFYEHNHHTACLDTACHAVTGALHILDIDDFVELGGLNILLATAFQDIDLCIKAIVKNMSVYYIGSECMYHAESLTNAKENMTLTNEFMDDHIVWDILWNRRLEYILGLDHRYIDLI